MASSPDLAVRLADLPADGHARLIVDLAELKRIDSTGVAVILEAASASRSRVEVKLRGAKPQVRRCSAHSRAGRGIRRRSPGAVLGSGLGDRRGGRPHGAAVHRVDATVRRSRLRVLIAPSAVKVSGSTPLASRSCFGSSAIPIVGLIALLIGLIMGMQSAHQLRQFGAAIFVADLVGIAVARLGPLATAIVVAGRSGSAVAAELGTMVVSEELDALRTMGLNPMRYLIVPRILAMTICVPILAAIANLIAIIGGMMIGVFHLGISVNAYYHQTLQAITLSDLVTGLVKSLVFGIVIGNVGVFEVLHVRGSSEGGAGDDAVGGDGHLPHHRHRRDFHRALLLPLGFWCMDPEPQTPAFSTAGADGR